MITREAMLRTELLFAIFAANRRKQHFPALRSGTHGCGFSLSFASHDGAFCIDVTFHANVRVLIEWYSYGLVAQWARGCYAVMLALVILWAAVGFHFEVFSTKRLGAMMAFEW
jgi:hypothetical protein